MCVGHHPRGQQVTEGRRPVRACVRVQVCVCVCVCVRNNLLLYMLYDASRLASHTESVKR